MRAIIAVVCLTSVSCTSPYPSAIPEPVFHGSISCDPKKNKSECINEGKSEYEKAANYVKIYEMQLGEKEQQLATQKYVISDTSATGAVTSVIAAASGALTTALYAGGVSVVGGAAGQRYNYDTQLLNYRTTRQKLNCIYRSMMDISSEQMRTAISEELDPTVVQLIRPYLNSVMSDLVFELQSEQAAVSLVVPNVTVIADTLDQQLAARKKILTLRSRNRVPDKAEALAVAELIRTNIKMCKASPLTEPVTAFTPADTAP